MARYVTFFSYTADAAARMVERPADRAPAARAVIEAAGGRLEAFYWMFGDHDGLAIYEVRTRPRRRPSRWPSPRRGCLAT